MAPYMNGNTNSSTPNSTAEYQETIETSQGPVIINGPSPEDVKIADHFMGGPRKLRVAMIGSGMSGINFFKFAEEQLSNVEIVCFEKNNDIGGTWLENRYPGCACDIPSVVYQFPWRPASWSSYYSKSPEIWEYVKMVERENNFIDKYVKLRHQINGLSWNEETPEWTLNVEDLESSTTFNYVADLVIDGGGVLNRWKWPEIPGLHTFKGTLVHSAAFDQTVSLKGKRVALIGAGSSGVQILPNIYDDVSHVYTWVRSRIWITAGFAQAFAGKDGANFKYTEEQHKVMQDPDAYLTYRKMIEGELNQRFSFIINGSQAQKDARAFSTNEMKTHLKSRPDLLERIMPTDFDVGCRRPTPGNGYLQALTASKTTAYTEQLRAITENGFLDEQGTEVPVDVIICATGFDTSYRPRFPILVNGTDMGAQWAAQRPTTGAPVPSYLSLAYGGVPNYLISAGAFCPSAHGSFFPLIDAYVGYFIQVIRKMQTEDVRSFRPKEDVTEKFLRHAASFLKRTAWTGPCSSWFKGGKADGVPAIWPGSRLSFLRCLEKVRWEDFELRYVNEEDPFGFLGNGFHVCERDGSDITWYLGAPGKKVDEKWLREQMSGEKGEVLAS